LGTVASLAFTCVALAQPAWVKPEWQKPFGDRVAAISNVDTRLAAVEKSLDAAKDKTSLSATTARYTLELFKDAKSNPSAYGPPKRPAGGPGAPGGQAGASLPGNNPGAGQARRGTPTSPPAKLSEMISNVTPMPLDLEQELERAEQLAVAIQAGKDPMAGIKGDVHLAYRSELDSALIPFRVYIPKAYDATRPWPLVVFLHGSSCDENTYMAQDVLQPAADRYGYLIVSVNGRGPFSSYLKENGAQRDVLDVLALVQKYYKVNDKRIYLNGHSMGGGGTWTIGTLYRDTFAAIAPMSGVNAQNVDELDAKLAVGGDRKIPILITAGGKDTISTAPVNIAAYEKVKTAGYPTKVVVYPDSTHEPVFQNSYPEVFAWFDKYSK
jgi:poly(3-hydroxybutyrate) depolymerase